MATNRYQNFANGLGLVPNASTLNTAMGDLEVLNTGILNYYNGTTSSQVLTAAHTAVLTSKTISFTTNTITATSAELATAISDETGTGVLVFNNSPTLITPALGTPSALVGTNITGTAAGLTAGNVTTNANLTGVITSIGNATSIASQTGTGSKFVVDTSPTLITPNLGTPTTLVGTNITGTATAFTASNVTTNANLTGPIISVGNATSIASQTGTGSKFVVDTSPTLVTPILGVATATSITGIAAGALTLNSPSGQNVVLQNNSTTTATVTSTGLTLASAKTLVLTNNSQTVSLQASASASATYTITLPAAAATANTALVYDGSNYVWGQAGGWSLSNSTSLTAAGTITISLTKGQQAFRVASSSGDVTLSTTPFGASAPTDGTVMRLIGTSDTNTVSLTNNTGAKGCRLNGNVTLYSGSVIDFMYSSTDDTYYETSRSI